MRTSFRAALTDWKCVVQKAGVPLSYRHHALMRLIICVHAVLETLATYEMEQAKRTRPSKQDQASYSKWKDAGCFLAKQQPLPCIFLHKSPHEPFVCEMCRGGTMNRHQPIQQNI